MISLSKEYYLSLPKESDANDLIENLSNPEINQNLLKIPEPYGLAEALEFISRTVDYARTEAVLGNRIIRNQDEKLIGGIGSNYIDEQRSVVEIGYWLQRSLHGRGIMTFIVNRYCSFLFSQLPIHKIQARIFSFNKASGSMLIKAGFSEGELLRGYYQKGGKSIDAIPYTLHKSDHRETIKYIVEGKVQGVFFRKYTRLQAIELGITGSVRNLDTGEVEVIATGSINSLNEFAKWLKIGSPMSKVSNVISEPLIVQRYQGFNIVE